MIQILLWLLPASRLKNRLLSRYGHEIDTSAHVGPNLVVGVRKFQIGANAAIGPFNVIRDMGLVRMSEYAIINSWNWISAHPIYQTIDPSAGTLFIGTCARIGSRNYLDSSGTIIIRAFAYVGGNKCVLQTHEPHFATDEQSVGRITVGHHSMVGTRAVLLKGAALPDKSLLAANSTLVSGKSDGRQGLYAGAPAVWRREVDGEWFTRNTYTMGGHLIEEPMGVLPDDLDHDGGEVFLDRGAVDALSGHQHAALEAQPVSRDLIPPL